MSNSKINSCDAYDLIGDIHGCHNSLTTMLGQLGYSKKDQIYQHHSRKVIFLGDFVDRGAGQRAVIDIVRPMIDSGAALSVMGNHEYNAIAYATNGKDGKYLREHSDKNKDQHKAFLNDYQPDTAEYLDIIQWFKSLPLWLGLGGLRVVHACWDTKLMRKLQHEESVDPDNPRLTESLILSSGQEGTWQYEGIELLLKGKEIKLPNGQVFYDKEGNPRHNIRVRWWDKQATTYPQAFMGPKSAITHIPDDPIHGDHLIEYGRTEPPVFLGHYWLEEPIEPLANNIACLDYSVARQGGRLVAYRWDGEQSLDINKFVSVARDLRG
ncbi:MAG: metallophosphoesterase [Proteobacteria bacterium]|nr:metallophosphoesterase [Pseudomonadota bacterium]